MNTGKSLISLMCIEMKYLPKCHNRDNRQLSIAATSCKLPKLVILAVACSTSRVHVNLWVSLFTEKFTGSK